MEFDAGTGYLTICDLGHSYIYIFRNNKLRNVKLTKTNPPLGIFPDLEPQFSRVALNPDDIVFTFTDGLIEQPDPDGIDYSIDRIAAILDDSYEQELITIRQLIVDDFYAYKGNRTRKDDLSFSMLRYP